MNDMPQLHQLVETTWNIEAELKWEFTTKDSAHRLLISSIEVHAVWTIRIIFRRRGTECLFVDYRISRD